MAFDKRVIMRLKSSTSVRYLCLPLLDLSECKLPLVGRAFHKTVGGLVLLLHQVEQLSPIGEGMIVFSLRCEPS